MKYLPFYHQDRVGGGVVDKTVTSLDLKPICVHPPLSSEVKVEFESKNIG